MVDYKIWYEGHCDKWLDALPLGNGHMGAMAYGGQLGRYDLSEATCWSGGPQKEYVKKESCKYMELARKELINGNYEKGEKLLENCTGVKENFGTNLPLGTFWVSIDEKPLSEKRELNLNTGVNTDTLNYSDKIITRETFISNAHKAMIIKIKTSNDIIEKVTVKLQGYNSQEYVNYYDDQIILKGIATEKLHSDGKTGVTYMGNAKIITNGKTLSFKDSLTIENSSYIIVILALNTNMFVKNQEEELNEIINSASKINYDELLESHIKEHRSWMDKCDFSLGSDNSIYDKLSTDDLITNFKKYGVNNYVAPLFFQYGRYLILSSSRPDSLLPAALQGIWNDNRACTMQWTNDMHLDINTQMNYFPTYKTGLGECCKPLQNWINNILVPEGEKIAKALYNKNGWVAHTVSNAFGWAAPGWDVSWGFAVSCGGWISTHLWGDYLFTQNKETLRKNFSTIKSCGEFLLELLMENSQTSNLITCPSYSPENGFIYNDKIHFVCAGSTFDISIAKYIFKAIIEAEKVLDIKDGFTTKIKTALDKLPEFVIGSDGQLLEWNEEFKEPFPDHRHTSHLLSMYPFKLIDTDNDEKLKEAIINSINKRLGPNAKDIVFANWAGALLVTYNARLKNTELANEFLNKMMHSLCKRNLMITHIGEKDSYIDGIYELDGNTGLTDGIVEMLIQYNQNDKTVHILPCLPNNWTNGEFKGLITENGYKFNVKWENNVVVSIEIYSTIDDEITVKFNNTSKKLQVKAGEYIYI